MSLWIEIFSDVPLHSHDAASCFHVAFDFSAEPYPNLFEVKGTGTLLRIFSVQKCMSLHKSHDRMRAFCSPLDDSFPGGMKVPLLPSLHSSPG